MLEIRVDPNRYGAKIILTFIVFLILVFLISGANTLLSLYIPNYPEEGGICIASSLSLLVAIFLGYRTFGKSPLEIALSDNLLYMDTYIFHRSQANLDYTERITFSKGLKAMNLVDAQGRRRSFDLSAFNPESVLKLVEALSEVADKYGFLLVDENSGRSWGKTKGHALVPEEQEVLSEKSEEELPYRVK